MSQENIERFAMEIGPGVVWVVDLLAEQSASAPFLIFRGPDRLLAATAALNALNAGRISMESAQDGLEVDGEGLRHSEAAGALLGGNGVAIRHTSDGRYRLLS